MTRAIRASAIAAALFVTGESARAEGSPPNPSAPPTRGLAVVALAGAEGAAWPLARAVYARDALRPAIDEAHARVLAGESPADGAAQDLADLDRARASLDAAAPSRPDDATRRALLRIAEAARARGLVVVSSGARAQAQGEAPGAPYARVFLVESGQFDAPRYAPDDGASPAAWTWTAAARSMEATYGALPRPLDARPSTVKAASAREAPRSGPFYTSTWFWAAIGAAAFGGAAIWFVTRDNGHDTIHVQLQVPR